MLGGQLFDAGVVLGDFLRDDDGDQKVVSLPSLSTSRSSRFRSALEIARRRPGKRLVGLGIGFGGGDDDAIDLGQRADEVAAQRHRHHKDRHDNDVGEQLSELRGAEVRAWKVPPSRSPAVAVAMVRQITHGNRLRAEAFFISAIAPSLLALSPSSGIGQVFGALRAEDADVLPFLGIPSVSSRPRRAAVTVWVNDSLRDRHRRIPQESPHASRLFSMRPRRPVSASDLPEVGVGREVIGMSHGQNQREEPSHIILRVSGQPEPKRRQTHSIPMIARMPQNRPVVPGRESWRIVGGLT